MIMPLIVAMVFIVAIVYKWELTALIFGIILITYACSYDPNAPQSMYQWEQND